MFKLKYHFGKMAAAPFHYQLLRHFGSICDGITGLIMLPFGKFGTSFNMIMTENILIWQSKKHKVERDQSK
jgi:hypothetical protein